MLDDTKFCEAENELVLSRVHRWVCDGTLLAAGFHIKLKPPLILPLLEQHSNTLVLTTHGLWEQLCFRGTSGSF